MTPAVTVLMPVFNGRRFLRPAIESVLRQTFADFELLVVDDGSTDGSGELARSFVDPRIRVVRLASNRGRVAAANLGVEESRAPLIARLDADDLAMPERLERQAAFLDTNPAVAAVGSWTALIDENGHPFMTSRFPTTPDEIYSQLLGEPCFAHSCTTFRKAQIQSIGGYRDVPAGLAEDYDLWLRLAERFDLANLPEVLGCYRVHRMQISQTEYVMQRHAGNAIRYAAALERHRLGRLEDPGAYAPPDVLGQLRGLANTPGADCASWSKVYRGMRAPRAALGFAVRACVRSPLSPRSWKAFCLAIVEAAVPRSFRQGLAWYASRLREVGGTKPTRDRLL